MLFLFSHSHPAPNSASSALSERVFSTVSNQRSLSPSCPSLRRAVFCCWGKNDTLPLLSAVQHLTLPPQRCLKESSPQSVIRDHCHPPVLPSEELSSAAGVRTTLFLFSHSRPAPNSASSALSERVFSTLSHQRSLSPSCPSLRRAVFCCWGKNDTLPLLSQPSST